LTNELLNAAIDGQKLTKEVDSTDALVQAGKVAIIKDNSLLIICQALEKLPGMCLDIPLPPKVGLYNFQFQLNPNQIRLWLSPVPEEIVEQMTKATEDADGVVIT